VGVGENPTGLSSISKSSVVTILPGVSSRDLDQYVEYVSCPVPQAPRSTSKRAWVDDTSTSASVVKKPHHPSTLPSTQVVGSMLLGEHINMFCLLCCLFASLIKYFILFQMVLWLSCSRVKRMKMMMRPSTHVSELLLHSFFLVIIPEYFF
jgi:hypothetical protein